MRRYRKKNKKNNDVAPVCIQVYEAESLLQKQCVIAWGADACNSLTSRVICMLGGKIPLFVVLLRSHSIDSFFGIFGKGTLVTIGKAALKPTLGVLIEILTQKGEEYLMKRISEVWQDKGIAPADLKNDINKLPDTLSELDLPLFKIKQDAVELVDKYYLDDGQRNRLPAVGHAILEAEQQ